MREHRLLFVLKSILTCYAGITFHKPVSCILWLAFEQHFLWFNLQLFMFIENCLRSVIQWGKIINIHSIHRLYSFWFDEKEKLLGVYRMFGNVENLLCIALCYNKKWNLYLISAKAKNKGQFWKCHWVLNISFVSWERAPK